MSNATRSWTRLLAVLFAFALIAAACGGDDDAEVSAPGDVAESDGGDTAGGDGADAGADGGEDAGMGVTEFEEEGDETPVPGGTLRFGINADVDGINPTTSALSTPGLTMANAVFDTLAAYDVDGNAVPYLAESFTPNEDFTSWTIKLREGISFHDGTPLDADAAIVNFETQRDDPLVGIAVRAFADPEAGVTKIDDLTFQVDLLEPWQYFPAVLASQLGLVASPTWLAAALEDPTLNQEPVGTGPFVFESRSQDSVTRFVRNDDYWAHDVYLDAVEFFVATDDDIRTTLFLEGSLEGLHTNGPASIDVLMNEEGVQNAIDDTGEEQLDLINTAAPPFDDIRARQALTYATPQENYVALLGLGIARRADQFFEPGSPYHNPDVVQETDRPDEAVALAAEYCADFPENCTGDKINITRQTSGPSVEQTREAEILAEGWSVAFNVSFEDLAEDAHIQEVALGQYQVADWRQFGSTDPSVDNTWLVCRTIGVISLNWPRYCDEERDALLFEAQAVEPDARVPLYQEVVSQVQQAYTYLFHLHTVWDIAYQENVRGACDRTSPEGVELRCQVIGRTWYDTIWLAP